MAHQARSVGKGQHFIDARGAGRQHEHAIEARARRRRNRAARHPAPPAGVASSANVGRPRDRARLLVRGEAQALLGGARELVVAVGELHAAMIELEAQRDARIFGIEARQRRLRRRIAMHEGERRRAERRAHLRADDEIEQFVAAGCARACRASRPERLRRALQRADRRHRADRSPRGAARASR